MGTVIPSDWGMLSGSGSGVGVGVVSKTGVGSGVVSGVGVGSSVGSGVGSAVGSEVASSVDTGSSAIATGMSHVHTEKKSIKVIIIASPHLILLVPFILR
jgi:hypothetical protein